MSRVKESVFSMEYCFIVSIKVHVLLFHILVEECPVAKRCYMVYSAKHEEYHSRYAKCQDSCDYPVVVCDNLMPWYIILAWYYIYLDVFIIFRFFNLIRSLILCTHFSQEWSCILIKLCYTIGLISLFSQNPLCRAYK